MRIFKHPIKKLTLLAAFGGGYVLGAKAGHERYEQIKHTATQVKDDPRVQEAASRAEDIVRDTATKVTDDPRVKDVVSRAEDILRDAGLHTSDDDSAAPKATVSDDSTAAAKLRDVAQASGIGEADSSAAGAAVSEPAPTSGDGNGSTHPLLADEHIGLEEEVVYTAGPDIEESIDQLADIDAAEQNITDDKRDDT
jgi:hypothetical protein